MAFDGVTKRAGVRRAVLRTVFAAVAVAVALEVGLRVLALFPGDGPVFVNDARVGYRVRSNVSFDQTVTNSHGFNDVERAPAKGTGETRIAFIGDSFVFGQVARASLFTSLVQTLATGAGAAVEVLNMGIPGAGPRNYLALIREDAASMQVDVVGVVFFVGNDIVQSHPDFEMRVWRGSIQRVLRHPLLIGPSPDYSYLYRTLRTVTRLVRERVSGSPEVTFSRATFLSIEYQRAEVLAATPGALVRQSYAEAARLLRLMASAAGARSMRLFVVLAPDQLQVDVELQAALRVEYGMRLDDYDFERPQRVLMEALRTAGIPALDLLPALRDNGGVTPLYLRQDTHWNEAGHRVVADRIWSFVRELRLVPGAGGGA